MFTPFRSLMAFYTIKAGSKGMKSSARCIQSGLLHLPGRTIGFHALPVRLTEDIY